MRKAVTKTNRVELLDYPLRGMLAHVRNLKELGVDVPFLENLGDPYQQGYEMPEWIREIIEKGIREKKPFCYPPTLGFENAREYVAQMAEERNGIKPKIEDVVFFSGLGHGIDALFQAMLGSNAKVIGPSPTYPSFSSFDGYFSGQKHLMYKCEPNNNWEPDLEDLESKIRENENISFILTILPNNPTGQVYSRDTMKSIADLARKYDVGVISDETYINLVYPGNEQVSMARVLNEGHQSGKKPFPLVVLRSMSKDVPWPGARGAWAEFYNLGNDRDFDDFENAIKQILINQVGSTALPQAVLPDIYSDPRYSDHLNSFVEYCKERSDSISSALNQVDGVSCVPAKAAFYLAPFFEEGAIKPGQKLHIENPAARKYVEQTIMKNPNMPSDEQFALQLAAQQGVLVVPLSRMKGPNGFRVTALRPSMEETKHIYEERVVPALQEYLSSK